MQKRLPVTLKLKRPPVLTTQGPYAGRRDYSELRHAARRTHNLPPAEAARIRHRIRSLIGSRTPPNVSVVRGTPFHPSGFADRFHTTAFQASGNNVPLVGTMGAAVLH